MPARLWWRPRGTYRLGSREWSATTRDWSVTTRDWSPDHAGLVDRPRGTCRPATRDWLAATRYIEPGYSVHAAGLLDTGRDHAGQSARPRGTGQPTSRDRGVTSRDQAAGYAGQAGSQERHGGRLRKILSHAIEDWCVHHSVDGNGLASTARAFTRSWQHAGRKWPFWLASRIPAHDREKFFVRIPCTLLESVSQPNLRTVM